MKQYVISLALLIATLVAFPTSHANAQSQAEMNRQAAKDFEKADAELNKTYEALLAKLRDAESKQKLKETERAWLASRDTEAARAADQAGGGSMAPTLRYETMTHLTRERIKEVNNMLDHGTQSGPKLASSSATTSPSSTPESTSAPARSVSDTGRTSSSSARSVSPDKQWEYKCVEYGAGECLPQIVKAGTTQVVVDLSDVPDGARGMGAEILWAPDSKRFAFNYSTPLTHHSYETVAFYQLRGDKWEALRSLAEETTESLARGHVPKNAYPRHCNPDHGTLKLRNWTDANTAILYAPCYARSSGEIESAFLFTLKFDEASNWKIVNGRKMSKKELEEEQ